MLALLNLCVESIFINNLLFSYFLGMAAYLAYSKTLKSVIGLGLAVFLVITVTTPINWLIFEFILTKSPLNLSFLVFITFIASIASVVYGLKLLTKRFSPLMYVILGGFLPLLTVSCAVLGASLLMVERRYSFTQATAFGFSSGLGWLIAIVAFYAVQQKLKYADIPSGLQGFGINMLTIGLMALAFMGLMGFVP